MPLSSLTGTTNEFTVNNTDPTNPIIGFSSSFAFPTNVSVSVAGTISAHQVDYTTFNNIFTPLNSEYPPAGQTSFLVSDNAGNLSFDQYFTQLLGGGAFLDFTWGFGGGTLATGIFIHQIGNQIVVTLDLENDTDLNSVNHSFSPPLAQGCNCGATAPFFISQPANIPAGIAAQIIPSYLASGESLCIGQLPIAQINPSGTNLAANCAQYFLGNFYLQNSSGNALFYFTLGSSFGATAPSSNEFTSGNYYAFGYIGSQIIGPINTTNPNPTFGAATYTYSLV